MAKGSGKSRPSGSRKGGGTDSRKSGGSGARKRSSKADAQKSSKGTAAGKAGGGTAVASATEGMSVPQKVAWYSLLAMVFIVPLAMSNASWLHEHLGIEWFQLPLSFDQFDIIKVFFQRTLGLVALTAWGWHMLTRGGKIRHTPVDWLILAFLGWVAISMFFSISPATAFFGKYRRFEGLLSFMNYAVIYFLVLQFADRPSRVRVLAETLFWSSCIVAGYGVLQSLGADPTPWHQLPFEENRPFSTYGNPDLFGGFLMFSLPVALALALAEKNTTVRLVYWFGFGVNCYVWIVSFTRGAWVGGVVGLALMGIVAWRQSAKVGWLDAIPAGLTGVLGIAAIVKSLSNPSPVMNFWERVVSIPQTNVGSGLTRMEIWQAAAAAITDSPKRFILGYGADTFRLVFPKFKPVEYTRDAGYLSVADNVHNYPLQLAAGIGVVGVAMMYAIFAWAAARSAKLVFSKTTGPKGLLVGGFWTAAAGYLTQLMFGLSVTGNTFLLWVCMAVVLAPGAAFIEVKPREWGQAAATIALVLATCGVLYQFVLMYADRQYLMANVSPSGTERIDAAELARSLNPFNDMYRAEVGMAYRQQFVELAGVRDQARQSGKDVTPYTKAMVTSFDKAIEALEDAVEFVPDEYDNYVFLASTYNAGGVLLNPKYYEDAIEWAEKGVEVEPFGPAVRVEYARALVSVGRTEEGIKMLESAWGMDNAYAEAAKLLSEVYVHRGEYAKAVDVLEKTRAANPSSAEITSLLERAEASAAALSTASVIPDE